MGLRPSPERHDRRTDDEAGAGGRGPLTRRDALKLAAAAVLPQAATSVRRRRILIAGGGIAGLSCAWELVRRGHEVTVLEASTRTGGHVLTIRDGLDDGLYADGGAEHFTQPGYERFWQYVKEFELPSVYYPRRENIVRWIRGKPHTAEMLADPKVLGGLGLNSREIAYLGRNPFPELAALYFAPYVDSFEDEYRPFDAGLNALDQITETELFRKDGASPAALEFIGGSGSALQAVWHAAILKLRGVPLFPPKVFRLAGGNQTLTDTFTRRLGERVRLGSPITAIEHGQTGVRVSIREGDATRRLEAEYLVCAISARMLQRVPVTPAWPEARRFAIANVPYYHDTRVIFQSRSRFWQRDGVSPNLEFGEARLYHVWSTSEEVTTARGLLAGTASGAGTAERALETFRRFYPGRSEDIEKTRVVVWALDPWASACERTSYRPGQLAKFWPLLIEPHGRIHFAGAYADNLNWGMEAATRSAHRVAEAIDRA
jgi:monoamine oxidase